MDQKQMDKMTLLEIIAATKSIHKMNVLDQYKNAKKFGGKSFNVTETQALLDEMVVEGLIILVPGNDLYKMTEKGKDLL